MGRRLNQIVAIEKGVKAGSQKAVDVLYKQLQKPVLFDGFAKSYEKRFEAGDDQPAESKRVQVKTDLAVKEAEAAYAELIDVTFTKDRGNCLARADVEVDGEKILREVPVTFLLSLEKRLVDYHTFISHVPTLDPAESWGWDSVREMFVTQPTTTARTKKVQKALSLAKATDKHAEQAVMITEDEYVGNWLTVKHSARWPEKTKRERLARVEKLQRAVKFAREEANVFPVEDALGVARAIFEYIGNTD